MCKKIWEILDQGEKNKYYNYYEIKNNLKNHDDNKSCNLFSKINNFFKYIFKI